MHNLLTDDVISVQRGETASPVRVTLPDVFAELSSSRSRGVRFPHLRNHHRQGLYMFLVQLGALALINETTSTPPDRSGDWRRLLRALTDDYDRDQPWHLVTEDLRDPAFMQAPIEGQNWEEFSEIYPYPDQIDIPYVTKNHELKRHRIAHPDLDHWLFSLITCQTMRGGGYGGYNYGICRMNGGYGSRPWVGIVPSADWGDQFRRDVGVLCEHRSQLKREYDFYDFDDGIKLTWLEPWDGETSLGLDQLDPYFIEICRQVRMGKKDGETVIYKNNSTARRVAGADLEGKTGDPWTPVEDQEKGLSVSERGFDYEVLRQIVTTDGYDPGLCMEHIEDDPDAVFLRAFALACGQGKTNGIHSRFLHVSEPVKRQLLNPTSRSRLADVSREMVETAGDVARSVLRPALLALVQGGKDDLNFQSDKPSEWLDRFRRRVDERFFPFFWNQIEDHMDQEDGDRVILRHWEEELDDIGQSLLEEAKEALPVPDARKYRAFARADQLYYGSRADNLQLLQEDEEATP